MRTYLVAAACLALASCAAQKALPQYTPEQQAAQRGGISYWQPDSTSRADTLPHQPRWAVAVPAPKVDSLSGKLVNTDKLVDKPTGERRLFGLLPPKKVVSSPQKVASDNVSGSKLPRKCKGCQITIQNGNGNTSGQASADKKGQTLGAGATNTQTGKKSGDIIKADSGATVYHAESKKGLAAAGKGISQTEQKPGFPWWIVLVGAGLYVGYKKFIA